MYHGLHGSTINYNVKKSEIQKLPKVKVKTKRAKYQFNFEFLFILYENKFFLMMKENILKLVM